MNNNIQTVNRQYFDTHCHWHYMENPQAAIQRAYELGVNRTMCVSTSVACMEKMQNIIHSNPTKMKIYHSAGIHPNDVKDYSINEIDAYLKTHSPNAYAIGETGLDDFRGASDQELTYQIQSFKLHMQYAKQHNIPIIMHLRSKSTKLEEIATEIIRNSNVKGIGHCFGGSVEFAQFLISQEWMVSFAGNITYSESLHAVIKSIPIENILIETDAPFLAPYPYRGKQNESSYIIQTLVKICDILKKDVSKVLYDNAMRIFNIKQ